jgi:hypothetical protein
MFVKALKSFATADLKVSLGVGFVHEIEDEELANQLIADGLVEKYEEIHPNGEIAITQNGTVDVSRYKTAKVNCGQWKVTFDGNNEQNETIAVFAVKGSSISLKRLVKQKSITACVSLSATGSKALPKSLTILNLRAIIPSAISVRLETVSSTNVPK